MSLPNYLILDLETNGTETYGTFCNPLDPRHSVEVISWALKNSPAKAVRVNQRKGKDLFNNGALFESTHYVVGQNFKFDMKWFWENQHWQDYILTGGRVWDTQTVEY